MLMSGNRASAQDSHNMRYLVRILHPRKEQLSCRDPRAFPGCSVSKESTCNAGDSGSIPGLGRSPGEGNGQNTGVDTPVSTPVLGLVNPMDRGAWWAIVHGVAKNLTQLSNNNKQRRNKRNRETLLKTFQISYR